MKLRNQISCFIILITIIPISIGIARNDKEWNKQQQTECHQITKPFLKSVICPLKHARRKINQFAKQQGKTKYFWKPVDQMIYVVDELRKDVNYQKTRF